MTAILLRLKRTKRPAKAPGIAERDFVGGATAAELPLDALTTRSTASERHMTSWSDSQIYSTECQLIALLVGGYLVAAVVIWLRRSRPGLTLAAPVAAAFIVRIFAAFGLDQTPVGPELRGGDETTFLQNGESLAGLPLNSSESFDSLTEKLHEFFVSINFRAFDEVPEMMLRFELISFTVVGLALLAAGVYELAGPRPAVIAAWVVGLEPTGVFFSGIIHKEPFMFLAEGMVVFGGALLWKRGDFRALVPIVLGCLIATATRPYVGWFLAVAAGAVALHAAVRKGPSRSPTLALMVVVLMAAFAPVAWQATSSENLKELQASQDANAADDDSNLALEEVDYSSRGRMVLNLPQRIRDVVLRPYPWQVENTSQQLGLIGTLVMLVGLVLLLAALVQNGGAVMRRAAPLVYPVFILLIAYALSAGNAGTAFRYRTHVVGLLLSLLLVLRQQRAEVEAGVGRRHAYRPLSPLPKTKVTA